MEKLIATSHILYLSKQYAPGDELPRNSKEMEQAWIDAKTAKLEDSEKVEIVEEMQGKKKDAKATPKSAPAGMTGEAVPSTGDDLVGKPPKKK